MASTTVSRYQPQTTGLTRLPDLVDRLFQESFVVPSLFWDRFNGGSARPSMPVNLFETTDSYVLQMALPGINPDNLDIHVTGREVTIKGRFEVPAPEGASWIWRGLPNGEFFETYTIPVDVEADKTDAKYEHGILWLNLPKSEYARPKSIKVSATK